MEECRDLTSWPLSTPDKTPNPLLAASDKEKIKSELRRILIEHFVIWSQSSLRKHNNRGILMEFHKLIVPTCWPVRGFSSS